MNMDKYTTISHKKSNYNTISYDSKIKYFRNLITRVLISIILIICACILIKVDDNNLLLVKEYVYEDSIKFTKINKWYQDNIGKIIPDVKTTDSNMVFSSDDLKKNKYEKHLDGIKIELNKNEPISILYGGIVVFIGEKDEYGNTLIIQGNDGIDYWYGNITNINVNLYDYLEKDTLVGEANDNYIYLVLEKDGKYLDYDEYI